MTTGADTPIPVWASPAADPRWPTRIVASEALGYRVPRPAHYDRGPVRETTAVDEEDAYLGGSPEEWLSIRRMAAADPRHELGNWVEAFLRLTGLPTIVPSPAVRGRLAEWRPLGACASLAARLAVDETRLFTGLVALAAPDGPPAFARLYVVLARRGTWAWKVCLALASACLPGTPEPRVAANDHVRAGASLGGLELAVPGA